MFSLFLRRLGACAGRFSSDERGAVLIYVSLMLPLFIGLSLLAVDGARVYNLGTELQKAADALALAGAAELDRRPDAITRAKRAITNMLDNEQRFAAGAARISYRDGDATSDVTLTFLRNLPDDNLPIDPLSTYEVTGANEAARSAQARFVRVVVNPKTLTTILPASFIGGATTVRSSATAVAGFTSVVCRTTPMFICNPWEGTETSIFSASAKGKQIKMQYGGGSGQYFPGNYGWLDDPSFGNGANGLRDAVATVNPPVCFEQNGVNQRTGQITSVDDALNVRFDLWRGELQNSRDNGNFRPAMNVRKGYAPSTPGNSGNSGNNGNNNNSGNSGGNGNSGACDPTTDATTAGYRLGRDQSFSQAEGRLGNGAWDFDGYWDRNYGVGSARNGWSNLSNRPSRYQVYRYEIGTIGGTNLVGHSSAINEVGSPTCYNNTTVPPSDNPDRRLIYAAIINCNELTVHGGSGPPMPVLAFGKFFLTEPVPRGSDPESGTIYSEFVDVIRPGSVGNEVARDKVQLYR